MKVKIFIAFVTTVFVLGSCNSEPTLQKYFIDSTENKNFVALDVSPSILNIDKQRLTVEENQALETFDKMNVLVFKANDSNAADYEVEKVKVKEILKRNKYQELMKFSRDGDAASVNFVGDENHIDEFVLYADKKNDGFAVVRITGKDMNPTSIMTMLSVLDESNIDLEQLKPLREMIKK